MDDDDVVVTFVHKSNGSTVDGKHLVVSALRNNIIDTMAMDRTAICCEYINI